MEAMKWDDDEMVLVDSKPGEMNPVSCSKGVMSVVNIDFVIS